MPHPSPDNLLDGVLTPEAEAALEALRQAMHVNLHDADQDGITYQADNCTNVANLDGPSCERDEDGIGNVCDCDFDNDGDCDEEDYDQLIAGWGQYVRPQGPAESDTDMNCDGVVGVGDFSLFSQMFGLEPGPSGIWCADPLIGDESGTQLGCEP